MLREMTRLGRERRKNGIEYFGAMVLARGTYIFPCNSSGTFKNLKSIFEICSHWGIDAWGSSWSDLYFRNSNCMRRLICGPDWGEWKRVHRDESNDQRM